METHTKRAQQKNLLQESSLDSLTYNLGYGIPVALLKGILIFYTEHGKPINELEIQTTAELVWKGKNEEILSK